jgi:2-methylisocitrate lyase-like PEP mutase family enzyme
MSLTDKAEAFHALHVRGDPLVLFNIWDAGSATAVADAGAKAIATGSWSVAAANGFADGEQVPLDLVHDNARRIAAASDLPVSLDIESGYGASADDVAMTMARVAATGVIGCNLEDSFPADGRLRSVGMQVERIRAARRAVDSVCPQFFINARTDVFFQKSPADHDDAMLQEVVERTRDYANVGADGVFVPGIQNDRLIEALCAASPLPVNIMIGDGSPTPARLAELGVARISYGPGPYLAAMQVLRAAAAKALSDLP